jgi:uncharacterized oligopeptide transporter (OPT) family protein
VELIAVVLASVVMYFPVYILQVANIKGGGTGFGDPKLPAPQAGLMAVLSQGIVGGDMPWPLVVTGISVWIGADPVARAQPYAGGRRNVSAYRHHVRHLRRRHVALGIG